jgi:hypothetical protein
MAGGVKQGQLPQRLHSVVAPPIANWGDMKREALVILDSAAASDSWGFVGVVRVGSFEAYRTIRAYASPGDAIEAVQRLLGKCLGTLMAGQEWNESVEELGHAPLRSELGLVQGRRLREEVGDTSAPKHANRPRVLPEFERD